MKKLPLSKTSWEVITTYSWGTIGKMAYPTRKDARAGMKAIRSTYPSEDGKLPNYIKSIELFRVKTITGLEGNSNFVSFYNKAR